VRYPVQEAITLEIGSIMSLRYRRRPALIPLVAALALGGCVAQPPVAPAGPPPPPVPRPSANVYFYPLKGQTAEQQDRDRYECYVWARQQTGFDPSLPRRDGGPPVRIVAVPRSGHDTVAGAATGAVIGAAVSDPWHSGEGAVIGAVAGAVIGAASDANRDQAAQVAQSRQDAQSARVTAEVDAQVLGYRNAMKACLSGRNYSVE
jgi:hypothetical protein